MLCYADVHCCRVTTFFTNEVVESNIAVLKKVKQGIYFHELALCKML